jgi:hypothetical protein
MGTDCGIRTADIAWCITKDHLAGPGEKSRAGRVVTRDGEVHQVEDLPVLMQQTHGPGFRSFRTKDDDGELYYCGRICDEWANGYEDQAFAPLDFARADAGAVTLMTNTGPGGRWEVV